MIQIIKTMTINLIAKIRKFFRKDSVNPERIVQILEAVKSFAGLSLVNTVTQLTPTPVDNMILQLINNNIEEVIKKFKVISSLRECNFYDMQPDLKTACILQKIAMLDKDLRGKHLKELGAKIISEHLKDSGIVVSREGAEAMIQEAYDLMMKGK